MKILYVWLCLLLCSGAFAQVPDRSQMSASGQSGPSEEARYVLGLVRNNRADLLNKYFDAAPWKIQTEIDVYSDANRTSSVAVFCVAVDLGYIDVVKAFVDHGYGPADLCRVQQFTIQRVIVSKADRLYTDRSKSHKYSSSSSDSYSRGWFSARGSSASSSSGYDTQNDVTEKYSQVSYGEKHVVKTYFANPLDFASGAMFDYLWEQGFRSNNLFTEQALAEAKRLKRMDVWKYIMDNKPEVLGDKPSYVSQADYEALLEAAKAGPNTLAYEALEQKLLGQVKTSSQAEEVRARLKGALEAKLAEKGPGLQAADTLGYGRMNKAVAAKSADLKAKEEAAVRARAAAAAKAKAEAEAKAKEEAEAKAKVKAEAEAKAKEKEEEKKRLQEFVDKEMALLPKDLPPQVVERVKYWVSGYPGYVPVRIQKAHCDKLRFSGIFLGDRLWENKDIWVIYFRSAIHDDGERSWMLIFDGDDGSLWYNDWGGGKVLECKKKTIFSEKEVTPTPVYARTVPLYL